MADVYLKLDCEVTPVLRESDAHMLALVEVFPVDQPDSPIYLEVYDPRLDPDERDLDEPDGDA